MADAGRVALVTGSSRGIGNALARALADAGATVVLNGINPERLKAAEAAMAADYAPGRVHSCAFDVTSDTGAARGIAWVEENVGPLDILVNNAGIMASPLARTPEGWELQFATNHLGHFALATGLHGALAAAGEARVVSVSSSAHHRSPVVFDDIHYERRPYSPWTAYGQSKTANVLFAVEASKRWAADKIIVNALMPGGIRTNLQRHVDDEELERLRVAAGATDSMWKTPEQGAATSILVATSPLLDGVGGRYFEDCNEAEIGKLSARNGVAPHALDPEAAARLWDVSVETLAGR